MKLNINVFILHPNNKISNMPVGQIGILKHPSKIERNLEADTWIFNNIYGGRNLRFPYNFIFFLLIRLLPPLAGIIAIFILIFSSIF